MFSNKPYLLNFNLNIPVGTILDIYEQHKDDVGEDLYREQIIIASMKT